MVKSKRKNTPKKLEKWKDNRKSIFWASCYILRRNRAKLRYQI